MSNLKEKKYQNYACSRKSKYQTNPNPNQMKK